MGELSPSCRNPFGKACAVDPSDPSEEDMIAWQDVLDQIAAGRPGDAACPFCKHKPVTVEEVDFATRISCSKCRKFVQGRFAPE
jgi:hypothetical protein